MSLILYATKLKNAIIPIKSLKLIGYLYALDIIDVLRHKILLTLKYVYIKYADVESDKRSKLEKDQKK
jgi:hypothetical protein